MKINVIYFLLFSSLTYASPLDSRAAKGGKSGGKGGGGGGSNPPKSQNNPPPPATSKGNVPAPVTSKPPTQSVSSSHVSTLSPSSNSLGPPSAASSTPPTSTSASSQVVSISLSSSSIVSISTLPSSGSSSFQASSSILSQASSSASSSELRSSSHSLTASSTGPVTTSISLSSTISGTSTSTLSTLTTSFLSSSVSSSSSSASSTSTGFICGLGCGSLSCPIKAKPSKRASYPLQSVNRRTLEDVSVGERGSYVLKTVLANPKTELDWNFLGTYAVSKQGTFGAEPDTAWVGGIEGCTGIAVVSEKGYWVAHLMEEAFIDGNTVQWDKMMNALRNGDGRYKVPGNQNDLFGTGSNSKIYLMKPKDGKTSAPMYTTKLRQIMSTIQKGALSTVSVTDFTYKKPVDEKEKNRIDSTTARGKLLVEYDSNQQVNGQSQNPQAAIARIWMEDDLHEQKWNTHDDQKTGATPTPSATPTPTPSPSPSVPENRPTCVSSSTKPLPNEKDPVITEAIDSICKSANINLSSAGGVSNTFNGKTADGQDIAIQVGIKISADQTGCPPSTTKSLPRRFCKTKMLDALRSCPNTDGVGFLGTKPLVWATAGLGCVDFDFAAA